MERHVQRGLDFFRKVQEREAATSPKTSAQGVGERDWKSVGHSGCHKNVLVPKNAGRGQRYCPNCHVNF